MSFENCTPTTEKEPHQPSLEAIKAQIEKLCGKENPEVLRTCEDKKGVYLHEVVVTDGKGDASLYSYRRVGNYPETKTSATLIDVAYFEGAITDDMCVGGDTLSTYDEMTEVWTDAR